MWRSNDENLTEGSTIGALERFAKSTGEYKRRGHLSGFDVKSKHERQYSGQVDYSCGF